MFDLAWSEIALIGVVALVVIGPKDLPEAIRGLARGVQKLRRMASEFQGQADELVREANLDEVRSLDQRDPQLQHPRYPGEGGRYGWHHPQDLHRGSAEDGLRQPYTPPSAAQPVRGRGPRAEAGAAVPSRPQRRPPAFSRRAYAPPAPPACRRRPWRRGRAAGGPRLRAAPRLGPPSRPRRTRRRRPRRAEHRRPCRANRKTSSTTSRCRCSTT